MNKLINFVKEFTNEHIPELERVKKIGRSYFLIEQDLRKVQESIKLTPYSAGLFMGELKEGKFKPGFPLLDIISKYSSRKAAVNDKGETLYLYKNNLMIESITDMEATDGYVLVVNKRGEALGYGAVRDVRGQKIVKHILDRSDFLKREN